MTSNGQFVHKLSSFLFLLPIESLRLHVRTGICLKNSSIIGDELSAAHKKLRIQFRKSFNKTKCYECTHCSRTFNLERVLNKHFSKEHEQENWLLGEKLLTLFSTNFYSDYYKALMKLSPEGEADFELDFQLVELQFSLSSLLLLFRERETRGGICNPKS